MTDPYSLHISAVPRPLNGPEGLAWWVALSLPWFRAMPYSGLESVRLTVGERLIREDDLVVRIDGTLLSLAELRSTARYWGVQDVLHIGVPADTVAPATGTSVAAEVVLRMPEGGSHGAAPRRTARGATLFESGADSPWSLGVCSFSFAGELRLGRSVRDCLEKVASIGGYGSIELLGAQVADGYPQPSAQDLSRLGGWVRDAGLVPLVYGAYTDPGRRVEEPDDDAIIEWALAGLDAAAALGSEFARINLPPDLAIYERAAELASERDLILLNELHAMTSEDQHVRDLLAVFAQLDSPNLGLTLDLSCVMRSLPQGFIDQMLRPVLPEQAVQTIVEGWQSDELESDSRARLQRLGTEVFSVAAPLLGRSRRLFRHSDPSWLPDVLGHTRVVHGKFFDVVDGVEAALPTDAIFRQFREAGFSGHILAEFEGHLWTEEPDTFGELQRFRDLVTNG